MTVIFRSRRRFWAILAVASVVYVIHLVSNSPATTRLVQNAREHAHEGRAHKGPAGVQAMKGSEGKQSPLMLDTQPLTTHPLQSTNQGIDFPQIQLNQRGHVAYDPVKHAETHPISLLIERAKKQAEKIQTRIKSVNSLQDSVKDYTQAWGMKPPKGFDRWYEFVKKSDSIAAASMFPMAHKPFLKFLGIRAKTLRDRININERKVPMYTLTFVPDGEGDEGTQTDEDGSWLPADWHTRGRGRVKIGGQWAWTWRCNNTLTLMLPILPKLPDEFFNMKPPLKLVFNADDGARGQIHHDFEEKSVAYAKAGKVWTRAQLEAEEKAQRSTFGWHWTCPKDSPLRKSALSTLLNEEADNAAQDISEVKSFVGDFYMNMDVCYNPELRHQMSFAINDERLANVDLAPYISVSRSLRNYDICMVALDAQYQKVGLVHWKDKTQNKIFWRGSPTGVSHRKERDWRLSQRHRLNFFAANESEAARPILIERGNTVGLEAYRVKEMNDRWLDVGLAGGPAQCSKEDGSCEELRTTVPWKNIVRGPETLLYKYAIDVDGNAWSSRFRRLLLSNHVVLKSTGYPEWFSDILVPWYHYVPIRNDYEDIYDIMAFFTGAPDASTEGHDDLAKEIAGNGLDMVRKHWRVEDMQSFVFLLFLEFWRLLADDREAYSYS